MLYCRIVNRKCEKSNCSPKFTFSCELLVAGLGTAGAIAAISGAESGLDTIGVESLGSMGGVGTAGGVWDYSWGNSGGRFEKLNYRAQKLGDSCFMHTGENGAELGSRFVHGSAKAYVLEDAAESAGCRLLFGTSVTGVFVEDGKIVGIECCNGTDRINISAKVIIDSTGDQIVVRSAGYPTRTTSDETRMKFARTRAIISDNLVRNAPVSCGQRNSELHNDFKLSEKLVEVGSRPPFLNEKQEENKRTVFVGELPGYRDTDRIWGIDTLELIPYLKGELVKEPLFYAFAPIDYVGQTGEKLLLLPFAHKLWWFVCKMREFGISVPVTPGMMIPDGSKNLIVASKGISVGDELIGCVRMKKDMERLGEAAAKLAYIAIKKQISIAEVDTGEVHRLLPDGFCRTGESIISRINGFMDWTPVRIPETTEEFKNLLASPDFGAAIIFALEGKLDKFRDEFEAMLEFPETRQGAAIFLGTLGLFGRKQTDNVYACLRDIAATPLPDKILSFDRLIQTAAIWLLGELKDASSVDFIKELCKTYSSLGDDFVFLSGLCKLAVQTIEDA